MGQVHLLIVLPLCVDGDASAAAGPLCVEGEARESWQMLLNPSTPGQLLDIGLAKIAVFGPVCGEPRDQAFAAELSALLVVFRVLFVLLLLLFRKFFLHMIL